MAVEIAEDGGRFYKRDGDAVTEITPGEYAQIDQAKQTGVMESMLVGAGRTLHNIGTNLGIADPIEGSGNIMSALREQNPVSTMVGEAAPMMVPVPGGAVAQIAAGGGLGYMGSGEGDQQGLNTALGAAGGGVGHMAGRIASRIAGVRSQNPIGMKQPAQDVFDTGSNVRLGEATGSDAIKTIERALEVTPGGKAAYMGTRGGRQNNVNNLVLDALDIGDQGIKAFDDNAVDAAIDSVGAKFDGVRDAIPDVGIPADLADDLRTYLGGSSKLKSTLAKKGAVGFDGDGSMIASGDAVMDMRSRLLKRNKTPSNDSPIYEDIIDSLDEVIEQNVPDSVMKEWADARSTYRFFKIAEKSRKGNGADISPQKLSNRMRDWRNPSGAIGDVRKNVSGLTSRDFVNQFGNSGTAEGLLGAATLPISPLTYGAAAGLNSLLDMGNLATRGGAAAGRGAGLFGGLPGLLEEDQP